MTKINPLVAMALPTWGKVSITWAQAYRHVGGPLGCNMVELSPEVGKPIAEARNALMQSAIDANCDFIFFLGDDVLTPPDTITRMLQRMWENSDVHIVTGMYWTKTWPTQPYIWRGQQRGPYMDWKHGEFFKIDYAGVDCTMIRLTSEMKELGPDWFSTEWTWEENEDKQGMVALNTEDFYFYTRARKAGLKLWCDSNIQCLHEDRESGEKFGLTQDMPQWPEVADEPDLPDAETDVAPLVKVADIGCGVAGKFFGHADKVKVVRFDGDEAVKPDFRCDIRRIPADDQSFDVVHAQHVLEHFGREDTVKVLKEWTRILRVGGEFRLAVPNILSAMKNILLMEEGIVAPDPYPFWQLYGKQDNDMDLHHNGFTPKRLQLLMERLSIFEDIEVTTGDGDDGELNVYAKARKATHAVPHALLPDWDDIEELEGITLAGHENGADEKENIGPIQKEEVKVGTGG